MLTLQTSPDKTTWTNTNHGTSLSFGDATLAILQMQEDRCGTPLSQRPRQWVQVVSTETGEVVEEAVPLV